MKLTLITACWNGAAVLKTALDSVLAQTETDYEYWVIDGGSTDGTLDLLKAYQPRFNGLMQWISEPDKGMYDALNKGISRAKGEFIGILNADDYLDGADVLTRVFQAFKRADDEKCDCVFGNVRFVKDFGGRTQRVCFARFWRPWMLQWGYMPPHPAIFIRRHCFQDWGGYVADRAEFRIAADNELLIRFFRCHQMSHRYMPVNTTVMRLGGVSTNGLSARKRLNEEIIKGNRRNGFFCCWPMLLPKYAVKVWEVILPKLGLI